MTSMIKSLMTALSLGALLTLGYTATSEAGQPFDTLNGIQAEAMNAQEMDAVQGQAFLGVRFIGQYMHWYDDEVGHPHFLAAMFDLNNSGVQMILQQLQLGVIPPDPNTVYFLLTSQDPQAPIRPTMGNWTANGPCIPGWTFGC